MFCILDADGAGRADLGACATADAQVRRSREVEIGEPSGRRVGHAQSLDTHLAAGELAQAAADATVAAKATTGLVMRHGIGKSLLDLDVAAETLLDILLRHLRTWQVAAFARGHNQWNHVGATYGLADACSHRHITQPGVDRRSSDLAGTDGLDRRARPVGHVATGKNAGLARHQRATVGDDETAGDFETAALDAGQVRTLANGEDHMVAFEAQPLAGIELRVEAAGLVKYVFAVLEADRPIFLDARRPPTRMHDHALGDRSLDLVRTGRHLAALFEADHVDLLRSLAQGGERHVDGDVAAADDDDARTDPHVLAAADIAQEIYAAKNEGLMHTLDRNHARHLRAKAKEHRVVILAEDVEASNLGAGMNRNTECGDLFEFLVQQFGRQTIGGDAVAKHAASLALSLEYFDVVTKNPQVISGGKSCGTGTDDADTLAGRRRQFRFRIAAIGQTVLGGLGLHGPDENCTVTGDTHAGRFAGGRTNQAAGQR